MCLEKIGWGRSATALIGTGGNGGEIYMGNTVFVLWSRFFILNPCRIIAITYFHTHDVRLFVRQLYVSNGSQLGVYPGVIICVRVVASSTNGQDFDLCYTL